MSAAFPGAPQSPASLHKGWGAIRLLLYSMRLINHPNFRLFIGCLMGSYFYYVTLKLITY